MTGASRGIGLAIALALDEVGADIAANYCSHAREAAALCRQVRGLGRRGVGVAADVSAAGDARQMVEAVERELGMPEEVAEVAVLLSRNGCITGQSLHVNGGWCLT